MIADKIVQPPNLYQQTLQQEKPENIVIFAKSNTTGNSRQIEANPSIAWRMLGLSVCVTSGAITAGGLAALIFDGFWVVFAAIFGGVWGVFIAACCQIAGAEPHQDYDFRTEKQPDQHEKEC